VVSSTRIREAIRSGNLDAASQMLGRAYALAAKVVRGDRLGRQLGFPTANLDVAGLAIPPPAFTPSTLRSRAGNIGPSPISAPRPTLPSPNPQLQVEAHLLNSPVTFTIRNWKLRSWKNCATNGSSLARRIAGADPARHRDGAGFVLIKRTGFGKGRGFMGREFREMKIPALTPLNREKTSNVQYRTPERRRERGFAMSFDVRRWMFLRVHAKFPRFGTMYPIILLVVVVLESNQSDSITSRSALANSPISYGLATTPRKP